MKLAIFKEEQKYHSDLESYCDQNCILQVLNHYGIRNPLLYFDTAPNIHLFKESMGPQEYNVEFNSNYMIGAYNNKIHKYVPDHKNNQEIWEENRARLREGVPIIAGIDMFCLPYSSNYNTYHSNHKCILCGYSEDDRYATLIDCYEWSYKGDVLLTEFLKARSSSCPRDESPYSGFPIDNIWLEVEDSNWSMDIRENLRMTIDKTVTQYYENELTNYDSDYYGVAALLKIKQLFQEKKDSNDIEKKELITNIRITFLCLYTHQKLFRYYMNEASTYVNLGIVSDVLESLNEGIELWRKATIMMLKGTVSVTENSYLKIINRISELIEFEEKRYHLLVQLNTIL